MKLLITHSYYLQLDPKEAANHKPYPPLAPLQLAAIIQREFPATEIVFHDVMFDDQPQILVQRIESEAPDVLLFYDDDFNYLTKMCLENMRRQVFDVLRLAHFEGLCIAHGSDVSDQADAYLRRGVNFVVHRNAEQVIVDLLAMLEADKTDQLFGLPSLSFLQNGKAKQTEMAKKNYPLEDYPVPAWELIDLEPYRSEWLNHHGYFSLNISTAHGCPYRCNWCAKPLYGRTYNVLPAQRVAEEIQLLKSNYQAQHLWVTDDIFALKPGWLREFADILEAMRIRVPFKIQLRADTVTEDFADDLNRAGCVEAWIGVESGAQKILDAMQKDTTIAQIESATAMLKHKNIQVGYFLQYGYPGEAWPEIQLTLDMLKRNLPDHIGISVSYPLQGTPFYESVANELGDKKNWDDSADLAVMFQGRYPSDFYRALHRFTHHYFGWLSLRRSMPLQRKIRRVAAQYRHIPGMLKYRRQMKKYLTLQGDEVSLKVAGK